MAVATEVPARTPVPLFKVKVFEPVMLATVAPTGMLALPLMRMPTVRIEVSPAVSVTLALPAVVVAARGPKLVVTPEALAVAACDTWKRVPSRMLTTLDPAGMAALPLTGMPT
jgi:hypothetical protein